ncbi:hypothetical protein [Nocardia farcinica]|uniref:hypothetical protein n=1 Tax=Nocardia farcinica TaxID=37329 RepID=UPI002457FB94|nr:hypothetical protein [Nocardia farcinica]
MTIIAAYADHHQVIIGCDTATDYAGTAIYKTDGKIGRLDAAYGQTVLLGVAGNSAILPVLLRKLSIEDQPDYRNDAACDRWANNIAEAATEILADANPALLSTRGDTQSIDGIGILAWRHHMWFLQTHSVIRPHPGILAIGSGTDIALGSLHTSHRAGADPEHAVRVAVELACAHADGCKIDDRGPVLHTTMPGVPVPVRRRSAA